MRAGRLRHRLTLQSKTTTQDAYGAAVVSWADQGEVWGAIEPITGKEYFAQDQVQSEVRVRIVLRYTSGLDTTWRVKHSGLYYDIVDVIDHDLQGRMMTLMARQGVSEDHGDEV